MFKKPILLLAAILAPQVAIAGSAPPPQLSLTDDEVFLSASWTFGQQSFIPQTELGYRNVDVESDGDVNGAGVSISFDWTNFGFDKIKLVGIKGNDNTQGLLGFGYSLQQQQWLGTAGVQGNHLFINADLLRENGFQFGGGVNTISDYDRPSFNIF